MAATDDSPLLTGTPETPWWLVGRAESLGPGTIPGEHWPKLETIDYISKLIVLIILVIAFPWLLTKMLTNPRELTGHAAGLATGPASMGV
jgi:hypothetical protein